MKHSFNKVIVSVQKDKIKIEFGIKNENNEQYIAKNNTIIKDLDNNPKIESDYNFSGTGNIYYINQFTTAIEKELNLLKDSKSAILFTYKGKTHQINYSTNVPNTHNYYFKILNPDKFEYEDVLFKDIEKYNDKYSKIIKNNNKKANNDITNFIKTLIKDNLDFFVKENLNNIGVILNYSIFKITNTKKFQEILSNKTVFSSPFETYLKRLAINFLLNTNILDKNEKYDPKTDLEKEIDNFIKNQNNFIINKEKLDDLINFFKILKNEKIIDLEVIKNTTLKNEIKQKFEKTIKLFNLEVIPIITKEEFQIAKAFKKNTNFYILDFIPEDSKLDNFPLLVEYNEKNKKILKDKKDFSLIELNGNKYFSNLNIEMIYKFKFINDVKNTIRELIDNNLKNIEIYKQSFNFIKNNFINILYPHSALKFIDIKTKIFPNISEFNSTEKLSVEDILIDNFKLEIFKKSKYYPIIEYIANKNNIKIPKINSLEFLPDKNQIKQKNEENLEINKNNLGMKKFKYIPKILVDTKERKQAFLSKIKKLNNFSDLDELKTILNETKFIEIITENKKNKEFFEKRAAICAFDYDGIPIAKLSLNIFQYLNFFEKEFTEIKNFITEKKIEKNEKYTLITTAFLKIKDFYNRLLEKDINKATSLASNFLIKNPKTNATNIKESFNEEDKEKYVNLQLIILNKLANFKILDLNLNKIKDKINMSNLDPFQKNKLLAFFKNVENIYFQLDELNKELIILQKTNPELKNEINVLIEQIIKEIIEIKKLTQKETNSFIHTVAILNNLIKIKKTEDLNSKINILNETYDLFRSWGLNAVGLSNEQFNDAINAVTIQKKYKNKVINFFHDMGTGKTRLALFYSLLYSALNPTHKSLFAIQNKNSQDIYEQLRDMLPSLTIFVNQNFKNKNNFNNNVEYPFDILNFIDINLINSNFSSIYINGKLLKKEIIALYPKLLDKFEKMYRDKKNNDLKEEIKTLKINKFNIDIKDLLNDIEIPIREQLSKLDNTFTNEDFYHIRNLIYKNLIFTAKFLNFLIYQDNIEITQKNKQKIINKILNLKKINEEYIKYLKNSHKENNIYLLSKNFINSLLKKDPQLLNLKELDKSLKDISTNNLIHSIEYKKENYNNISKEDIVEFIIDLYSKIDYSKMDDSYVYLINNLDTKTYLMAVINRILSISGINEIDTIKIEDYISINEEDIVYQKNEFIKNNDSFVEMKAIKSDIILEILKEINNKLKNEKLSEEINNQNIIKKINAYLLASIYINFHNSDFKFFEKIEMINKFLTSLKINIEIDIPFKKGIRELTYKISNSEVNTIKNPSYFDYIFTTEQIEKIKIPIEIKNIKLYFKNNNFKYKIDFNSELNNNIKVNYNASNYLILKDKIKLNFIIDEAHKAQQSKEKILLNNVNIVQLTGTPINGTPESLARIDNPFNSRQIVKQKAKIFQLNGGITKIENNFINLLFELPIEERKNFYIELYEIILLNRKDPMLMVNLYMSNIWKRYGIIRYIKEIIEKALKHYLDKNNNLKESVTDIYQKLKDNKLEISDDFIIKNFLSQKDISSMPGISNPKITKLLESVSSIKTQENRVYNLVNVKFLLQSGNKPENEISDIKNYSFYKKNEIIKVIEIYNNFKKLEKTKFLNELNKNIEMFYLNFNFDAEKEKKFEKYKKEIETVYKKQYNFNFKEFFKYLTPKTTTQSDTIDKYFEDAVYLQKNIPEEKIKALEFIIDAIKIEKEKELKLFNLTEDLNKFRYKFEFQDNFKKIIIDNKEFYPFFKYDLKQMFPDIFKEKVELEFNLLNKQDATNLNTLLKVYPIKSAELFLDKKYSNNEGVILYTSKNKELIFATLMFLEHLYKTAESNPIDKPHYILINITNQNIKKILSNIDLELFTKKNIYIKFTTPQNIYMDYNYSIPTTSKVAIIGNYASLAEGFRFPRNPNIFFNSYPINIATGLQASARAFFPGKVFKANIYLGCGSIKLDINYNMSQTEKNIFEEKFEKNKDEILSLIKTYAKSFSVKYDFTVSQNEKKEQKKVAESFITALNFIGASVEGYQMELDNKIIKQKSTYYINKKNQKEEDKKIENIKKIKH